MPRRAPDALELTSLPKPEKDVAEAFNRGPVAEILDYEPGFREEPLVEQFDHYIPIFDLFMRSVKVNYQVFDLAASGLKPHATPINVAACVFNPLPERLLRGSQAEIMNC